MSKNQALKIINPLLLVLLIVQAGSGFGNELLGKAFEPIHVGAGLLMIGLGIAHLVLNWSWVRAQYLKKPTAKVTEKV